MASLDKLAIRGIRSFDDKSIATIQFFSPVTVIVGHNGSGKTTIIECLKYATTGDQPPNTRGGAFIHDPKIANEKEVKAQVKLRFFNATGGLMLAVRNLSVTVKKTGMTMKTLESVLASLNNQTRVKRAVLSTKCAEMDAEIPAQLGVSKSVLENVIFCHQEDSYWPLAEASVLKKKFDDIFEATKYTKALDSIKNLRKERVALQKADIERLNSLQLEKSHADKLKTKIEKIAVELAQKQIQQEELKTEIDETAIVNRKFYENASEFRDIYRNVDSLENRKAQITEEIFQQEIDTQELDDDDETLENRVTNFDAHVRSLKGKRETRLAELQDEEAHLSEARREHVTASMKHGSLHAEFVTHEKDLRRRDDLIRNISGEHGIKGFEHSPLEKERVQEFIHKLGDLQRKQNAELDKVQSNGRSKTEDLTGKLQTLRNQQEKWKMERDGSRSQMAKLQSTVSSHEATADQQSMLDADIKYNTTELDDITVRLNKARADFAAAKHEMAITAKTSEIRRLEDEKDRLNSELRALSLQADSRAKLALKKSELSKKKHEISATLETSNAKHQELIGVDAQVDTMESDVDQALTEKERALPQLEQLSATANQTLHQIETSISNLKSQIKTKKADVAASTKKIDALLNSNDETFATVADAIQSAQTQVDFLKAEEAEREGGYAVYATILKAGQKEKCCKACDRKLKDSEMAAFEKTIKALMQKCSPQGREEAQADLKEWENEVKRLQRQLPVEAARDKTKNVELPQLQKQLSDEEAKLDDASSDAEKATKEVKQARAQLRELQNLKTSASMVTRAQRDVVRLQRDIVDIERELAATGSIQTTDDLQAELDQVSNQLKTTDRERQNMISGRDHQMNLQRTMEHEKHVLELKNSELKNKLKERTSLLETVQSMKREITSLQEKIKEFETKIAAGQQPVQRLENELRQHTAELHGAIAQAQSLSQELNLSVERLEMISKTIDTYIRERRDRELRKCEELVTQLEATIASLNVEVEQKRSRLTAVEKEINEGGATLARFQNNKRLRKLRADLVKVKTEIDKYDLEEAARAKRNFEKAFPEMEAKYNALKDKYARVGGEMSTQQVQHDAFQKELSKDFKDIYVKYREQLVKTKLSDMANSDLEKYAKALDNAIMKYHSLKMEEVNNTMRHLWNKTYQGTDIDGIKIRSDNDGATTTKRMYNYRVVMTKDQIEMDMRGRCSAGQKMLASIIIRLALSDSFGQNCGILALDEPTNALDTENIDALAASLVDIIRERKFFSSKFQLIIITHDEKFLEKLGEAEVMDYYWRVTRDQQQKSVIEKQRVG